MATIAGPSRRVATAEAWEIPKGQPFYAKAWKLARENPIGAIAFFLVMGFVFLGLFGPMLAPYDPMAIDSSARYLGPSPDHLFGTNKFGQDMFSRILSGARIDLKFGAIVLIFGFVPGATLGVISGHFGRWADYTIQRSSEAWAAFPQLFLLLTFIAAFGPGLKTVELVVAIGALFGGSRLLRAVALIERHKDYVLSARATGATEFRVLRYHVLPNIMPYILIGLSSVFAVAVLAEATLSFLGLGVAPGTPSWGYDLSFAVSNGGNQHLWTVLIPGIVISVVVLGFNLLGDTLRDVLDPRLRGSTGGRR